MRIDLLHALADPRWALDRLRSWRFSRNHPDLPWLNRHFLNILPTLIQPSDRGIEWGSGRSTLWFSTHVAHLISVEHDAEWFKRVRGMLNGKTNVELLLLDSPKYSQIADSIAPESLDFALVDGDPDRDLCAHAALHILKPGGLLILDNANWFLPCESRGPGSRRPGDHSRSDSDSWDHFLIKVAGWRHIWTDDGITATALWIKHS